MKNPEPALAKAQSRQGKSSPKLFSATPRLSSNRLAGAFRLQPFFAALGLRESCPDLLLLSLQAPTRFPGRSETKFCRWLLLLPGDSAFQFAVAGSSASA